MQCSLLCGLIIYLQYSSSSCLTHYCCFIGVCVLPWPCNAIRQLSGKRPRPNLELKFSLIFIIGVWDIFVGYVMTLAVEICSWTKSKNIFCTELKPCKVCSNNMSPIEVAVCTQVNAKCIICSPRSSAGWPSIVQKTTLSVLLHFLHFFSRKGNLSILSTTTVGLQGQSACKE